MAGVLLPTMSYLTDIYFECGAVGLLAQVMEKYGVRRPLVVTDAGIVQAGLLAKVAVRGPVFDAVATNPTEASAVAAVEMYRGNGCDGVIALGGGAPMDLAKIVALLATHAGPLEEYAIVRRGTARIGPQVAPVIAIPTTAGSGSEVGRAALVVCASGSKMGFLSQHLLPKAAICDPELTVSLPAKLTAATGMDAISHGVETFLSPRKNPVADTLALDALRRGVGNIEKAVVSPGDLAARSEMMLCSLEAGLAFQKGLGAVHSLSHPLGGLAGKALHHGTLNAIFLPHVLRFNAPACAEKMGRLAEVLGTTAAGVAEWFAELNRRLGLPGRLSELGVTRGDVEGLAGRAAGDHCSPTNPRELTVEACLELYLAAL